ncbi:MAG TPA: hypothetical protein VK996_03815 [Ramlibacter sp.]|nr:hypothetical protein [Ramlibacter sp.]
MNSTRQIRQGADETRGVTGQALDTTMEYASQALEKASERVRDLRYGARELATRGASSVGEYAQATTRYVSEQPLKSALIAAAIGAAIAGLVIALRRNSDNRYF